MYREKYSRKRIRELKSRWKGQQFRIEAIINDIRAGKDWTKNLLESKKKGWDKLSFLSSCPTKFKIPGEAAPRDLRGLKLENIDLSNTDGLSNSCIDFCCFNRVLFDSASLVGASLRFSRINKDCVFNRSNMQFVDLRYSDFSGVSLEGAVLIGADLRGANFTDTILIGANLKNIHYSEEPWWGFLKPRRWRSWTYFGGEFQSPNLLESEISSLDAKFIDGENLRWVFNHKNRIFGFVWYILSNYGRSPLRFLLWVFIIWVIFGIIYAGYPIPSFLEDTIFGEILCWLAPKIDWNGVSPSENFFRPFYFSAVTMTSLGFGDIIPIPINWKAQLYICIQVFLGYLILGMFIGILIQNVGNPIGSNFRKR